MYWPLERTWPLGAAGALLAALALSGSVCQEPEATLVLSGDEVLHQGPLSIDERELRAEPTAGELLISGVVHSDLDWPMTGHVTVALRDLDETLISSGVADPSGGGHALSFEVRARPGLNVVEEAELARYVIHAELTINGHTLRLRRSLYSAARRVDLAVALPRRLIPDRHFPVVATLRGDGADPALLRVALQPEGQPSASTLGALAFEQGALRGVVPTPADAHAGARLVAELIAPSQRQHLTAESRVASAAVLELLTPGPSAAPGDELTVVALLRDFDPGEVGALPGEICLHAQAGAGVVCHEVETDAAGVAWTRFTIGAALAGAALELSGALGGATAVRPIVISPRPRFPGAALDLDAEITSGGRALRAALRVSDARAGQRVHAELRLGAADGPLVAEREDEVDGAGDLLLPVPDLAAVGAERWVLVAGVEDALGRRRAASLELYAAESDAVLALRLPARVVSGEYFAAVVMVRDHRGRPLAAHGALRLEGDERAFHAADDGLAVIDDLLAPAEETEILVEALTESGVEISLTRALRPIGADHARLELDSAPQADPSGEIWTRLSPRGGARQLGLWLGAGGAALDAALGDEEEVRLRAEPGWPTLTVSAFGVDLAGELLEERRIILGAPSPLALEQRAQSSGEVALTLRRRAPDDLATVMITTAPLPLAPADRAPLEVIRAAVAQVDSPRARATLLGAIAGDEQSTTARLSSQASASAIAIARAKVEEDLSAIAGDVAERIDRRDLSAGELDEWVRRRARVYYDPWGQTYLFELRDGRLWLRSAGLDEEQETADDIHASIYLHAVFTPPSLDPLSGGDTADWAAAVSPALLEARPIEGTTIVDVGGRAFSTIAQASDGARAEAASPQAEGWLRLYAPETITCRRGDRFTLEIDVDAPAQTEVHLELRSEPTEAILLETDALELVTDGDGMTRARFEVVVADDVDATIYVDGSWGVHSSRAELALIPQPEEYDARVLAHDARLLGADEPLALRLRPAPSTGRRAPALRALLFRDGAQLAADMSARALPSRPPTLEEALLTLGLSSTTQVVSAGQLDAALARVHALQGAEGGVAPSPGQPPHTGSTLDALEALVVAGVSLGAVQPQVGGALGYLVDHAGADGALTPSTGTTGAADLLRARTRSTARLLRLLVTLAPELELTARATSYLEAHIEDANDALTISLVTLALLEAGAEAAAAQLRDALLSREHRASAEEGEQVWFPGVSGDGAEADLMATTYAAHALFATGTQAEELIGVARYLARWARPDRPQLSHGTLLPWLDALQLAAPVAGEVSATLTLPDGTAAQLDSGASDPVSITAAQDASGEVEVLLNAPDGGLILVWLEGPVAAARTAGPALSLDAAPILDLTVGDVVALPVQIAPAAGTFVAALRSAPCLDVGLALNAEVIAPLPDGSLAALSTAAEDADGLAVLLAPRCAGAVSLPPLQVSAPGTPWAISVPAPRLVRISE